MEENLHFLHIVNHIMNNELEHRRNCNIFRDSLEKYNYV